MTNNISNVDLAELRSFYLFSPEAKIIFDHFSTFGKNMGTSNIDQLLYRLSSEQNPPSRGAVIQFFRKLQELGCGRFVQGRRGKKTRFVWGVKLTDVSHVAAGQNIKIGAVPAATEVEEIAGGEPVNDFVEHPFRLRKDMNVRLSLPSDLTAAEASRLAAFIQTLPFDPGQAVTRSA